MEDATIRRRPADRSTFGLLGEVLSRVTGLFRGELDLARAEMQENVNRAMAAVGMIVAAIVLFLVALNVLAAALVAGVAELGIATGWASLIVGGAFLIIGIVMALVGKNRLQGASLAPTRTTKNIRRDTRTVRGATTDGR